MERQYYDEMIKHIQEIEQNNCLHQRKTYIFGHCNATEELADLLLEKGCHIEAILDNNQMKYGRKYKGIPIQEPRAVLLNNSKNTVVYIATRFYEAMNEQLKSLGYAGKIQKLIDYNTYAEYSLSEKTIERKYNRVIKGENILKKLEKRYPKAFRIFCPFSALGDVFFCMSYFPYFLKQREILDYVVCVVGSACAEVVSLFGAVHVEVLEQNEIDAAIQAELYKQDDNAFIAHQDRPYVVNLSRALYIKKISLEKMYCCGVFGLAQKTKPVLPTQWSVYKEIEQIEENHAVILAPYAKSVIELSDQIWRDIICDFQSKGYQIFTNIIGDEKPLANTIPISPRIREMKSVVERAGIFIGIRSGLCDVIRSANCRKIALYPDYNYSDTNWKAIDIYEIDGFENIVVKDDFVWPKN